MANKIDEFEEALLKFVKRVSEEGKTAEELAALPAVAWILVRIWGMDN